MSNLALRTIIPGITLLCVLSALPAQGRPKTQPQAQTQRKENVIGELKGDPEFYAASAELESQIHDMARVIMSYSIGHNKEMPYRLKDDLNACDKALVAALKTFPMEEKDHLKKLKGMLDELRPLCEEVIEMDELYDSNVREAIDSAAKARRIMREKIRVDVLAKKDEKAYRVILPLYYEMEINLSETLSRYLFFITTGREDMKRSAEKDMAILDEALERYLGSVKTAKTEAKYCAELKSSVLDCMRSIQDAVEDYERLKPRVVLLQDRIFVIDHFIDIEIQKSPLR